MDAGSAVRDHEVVRWLVLGFALFAIGCGGDLPPAPTDGGASTDMTLLPLGTPCMTGTQCQSGVCFVGMKQSFCTLVCTAATAAQDCPVPPTTGLCNMQGFCKF
jgi:hypothetical protein